MMRTDVNRREKDFVFIYLTKRGVIIRKCQLQIELCLIRLVTRILYCIHHIYTVRVVCILFEPLVLRVVHSY